MPRKKKNGQSPARGHDSSDSSYYRVSGISSGNSSAQLSRSYFNNATGTFRHSGGGNNMLTQPNSRGSSANYNDNEAKVKSMQEMFSHLDPEVIYTVLSECDFKVENAMDSFLELSIAAEVVHTLPLSGFEMAAALLSPKPHPIQPEPDPNCTKGVPTALLSSSPRHPSEQDLSADLTEEFDLLIDRELETLTTQRNPPQDALPEQRLSGPGTSSSRGGPPGDLPGPGKVLSAVQASGPHSHQSDWRFSTSGDAVGSQQEDFLLDFSHLTSGPNKTGPTKPSLALGAPGHPSAFQAYRSLAPPYRSVAPPSGPAGSVVWGAREKTGVLGGGQEVRFANTPLWNTEVPEFQPRIHGNLITGGPVFITPVVRSPSLWHMQAPQWFGYGPVSQVPRSWTEGVAAAPRTPLFTGPRGRLQLEGRVLVMLRGAPGSGKTTLARAILEQNPQGVVLSTDDYFCRHGEYFYDPSVLGEAHEWNHNRAKVAMETSCSPVVIDNTNMQGWEMRPYVAMALRQNYKVLFREPDTWWKNKPRELERRSKHGVSAEKIRQMMDRYESHVTIQSIMGSVCRKPAAKLPPKSPTQSPPKSPTQSPPKPLTQSSPQPDDRHLQHKFSDKPCPDLVPEQQLVQCFRRPRPQIFYSLPDVSAPRWNWGGEEGMRSGKKEERKLHTVLLSCLMPVAMEMMRCPWLSQSRLASGSDHSLRDWEEREEVAGRRVDAASLTSSDGERDPVESNMMFESNTNTDQRHGKIITAAEVVEVKIRLEAGPGSHISRSTQTDPQDFAFIWRLEHDRHSCPDYARNNTPPTVLHGNPSRFLPEVSAVVSAGVAVHSSGQQVVPYRVGHDKGSQVEESELEEGRTRLENLNILRRHFKLVNWDTLDDLYNKCQQDLEWTSNLLLDSGERLFREEEEDCGEDEDLSMFGNMDLAIDSEVEVAPPGGQNVKVQASSTSCSAADGCVALEKRVEGVGIVEEVPVGEIGLDHSEGWGGEVLVDETSPLRESTRLESTGSNVKDLQVVVCLEGEALEQEEEEPVPLDELDLSLPEKLKEMLRREKEERREEGREAEERRERGERRISHLDIQTVELKLPTELALQLTELFGPVGVDPGACSPDDFSVKMDLNMAKLLHQKWKNTVQDRHRQAMLSYQLLLESSVHWGESQTANTGLRDGSHPAHFLIGADGFASLNSQSETQTDGPLMDHWSVSRPHISLRDIMSEEQALQESVERGRSGYKRKDGAAMFKETQLYDLFPTIDRHFLMDMFRDHNYCLEQTEQFLRSVLVESPVRNVVAPGQTQLTLSRDREKRCVTVVATPLPEYQDVEDPEYEDFRAEARLQRSKQQDSFSKASEAYRQGRKDVASFYAEQGHLHGQKMREANHRAAAQIFERVNSSLLPQNVLDLHGLHVDEALLHLEQVLEKKTTDCQQGVCCPQLSVITGRGNHSQGGVARIRPAVIAYLNTHSYRFTEPKPGLVLVSLN
ncbi:hypothetical protein DPEC_G00180330 [Dallia pectoralis]|uniref:Uncharacterized protein n=1 Tax=Dallia pectoralis TaxID=75939 RepID=A0ACC2GAF5_DALPE|nr:hypothetical protein DPEC_G00180330 [Dallia pectoralis]